MIWWLGVWRAGAPQLVNVSGAWLSLSASRIPGRQSSTARLPQGFLHMATENLKSSDGIKDVKTYYSQTCVGQRALEG